MTTEVEYQRDQARILEGLKTVIIWDQLDGELTYFVVDGDKRHLDGIYINVAYDEGSEPARLQDELSELQEKEFLDPETNRYCGKAEFPTTAVLEGAFVISCGFVP